MCCASRDQFCTCCVNRVVACELSVVCCCDICAFESCEFMRMIHVVCEFARFDSFNLETAGIETRGDVPAVFDFVVCVHADCSIWSLE